MITFGLCFCVYVHSWLRMSTVCIYIYTLSTFMHTYIMHFSCTCSSLIEEMCLGASHPLGNPCVHICDCMHASHSLHSVPVQQCNYGDIANGMITDQLTDKGEQVQSLTCDAGYQAVGRVTERECNHTTGNWNALFSCEG